MPVVSVTSRISDLNFGNCILHADEHIVWDASVCISVWLYKDSAPMCVPHIGDRSYLVSLDT
jgi:hypothetical protein